MQNDEKNERKRIQKAASNLERLIRLERKNRIDHFCPLTYKLNKKNGKNENGSLKGNIRYKDQMLKGYWEHIDKAYFKRIGNEDIAKLDWIFFKFLADYSAFDDNLYPDWKGFLALYKYYEELRQFHKPFKSLENDDKFFYNLMKHYYVSVKCYKAVKLDPVVNKGMKADGKLKRLLSKRKYAKISHYSPVEKNEKLLIEEGKILDEIVQELKKMDNNTPDEIEKEIERQYEELEMYKEINWHNIRKLKDFLDGNTHEYLMRDTLSRYRKDIRGKRNTTRSYNLHLQETYLRKKIFELELKQIAENVKSIIDVKMDKNKEVQVEVCFDPSITSKTALISEDLFQKINKKRHLSLLKLYDNLKKTDFDDFARFEPANGREISLKEILKLKSSKKNKWKSSLKTWEMCHHCKRMIPLENLHKCSKKLKANSNSKKSEKEKETKELFQHFMCDFKRESRVNCDKRYCSFCLKNDYDEKMLGLPKWVCPVCKGICFCSKCQRRDILKKMYKNYIENGGTRSALKYDSPLVLLINEINCYNKKRGSSRGKKKHAGKRYKLPEKPISCYKLLNKLARSNSILLKIVKEIEMRELSKKALFKLTQQIFVRRLERMKNKDIEFIDLETISGVTQQFLGKRDLSDLKSLNQDNDDMTSDPKISPTKSLKIDVLSCDNQPIPKVRERQRCMTPTPKKSKKRTRTSKFKTQETNKGIKIEALSEDDENQIVEEEEKEKAEKSISGKLSVYKFQVDEDIDKMKNWNKKSKRKGKRSRGRSNWWDDELDNIFTNYSQKTIEMYEKVKKSSEGLDKNWVKSIV